MNLLENVIVSIPFYSEDQFDSDIQKLVEIDYGISLIEIRFDFYQNPIQNNLIEWITEYLRSLHFKMIFTYQTDDPNTCIPLLRALISHKPDYIDLDVNIFASTLTELAEQATQNDVAIVFSYHNWEETPSLNIISDLCEFFIQMLPRFTSNTNHILKMVFMASNDRDESTIIEFCKMYSARGFRLISFCMGERGKNSRIQSIVDGCTFTYAYIGKPTAPGQLHVSEIAQYKQGNPRS